LNIVIALAAEAKPIIEHLGLKRLALPSPFSLFQDDTYQLVISGIGKKNMANAVSFLHGRRTCKNDPWLNIGLAGHGSAKLGEVFQITKFSDEQNGKSGFPPQIYSTPISKTFLHTCNQPSEQYQIGTAYDMEGSAFFETAYRFSTIELVQSVKIISDNPEKPVSRFDKSQVRKLIAPSIPLVTNLAQEMIDMSAEIKEPEEIEHILSGILKALLFTDTQTHQVKKEIRHALAVGVQTSHILELVQSAENSKSFITSLNQILKEKSLFP
jgi:nucleoside phosphorylase